MKRARFGILLMMMILLLIPASLFAGVPPGEGEVLLVLDEVDIEEAVELAADKADGTDYELLTQEEAVSYLNKLIYVQGGWFYFHPLLVQNLIAYDWIINAEPIVEVPDAVVITTKKDAVVKYNGPLSVQVGPLDYDITLPPLVAKDAVPRVEKAPLVWGVVGGFAGGVIITLLLSALL